MRLLVLWLSFAPLVASCGGKDCCKHPQDAGTSTDALSDASPIDVPTMPDAADPYAEVARVPATVNRDVDLLFVIDDSPSMLDKQTNLKTAFPAFVAELAGLEGGLPNVHIGVITTDLGTKGADDAQAGPDIGSGPGSCTGLGKNGALQTNGAALTGAFISDIKNTDGTRTINYSGSLSAVFSTMASVGASGCGFEQPLQAAKQALNANPANAGFLRANAMLAIIVLADEDDCSAKHSTLFSTNETTLGPLQSFRCTRFGVTCDQGGTTPDQMNLVGPKTACRSNESSPYLTQIAGYEQFFKGLKANPNHVMVSVLTGPPTPFEVELRTPPGGGTAIPALAFACTYNGASGPEVFVPGVRLPQLARRFARHTVSSPCAQDMSSHLVDIARHVRGIAGDACLSRTIATPYDCMVDEQIGTSSTPLPACDNGSTSTNKPCWHLVADPTSCSATLHLRLLVEREQAPVASAVVVARCRL